MFKEFYLVPISDSITEEAARLVVYNVNTNNPANIYSDRAGAFPYMGGVVTIHPGETYASFYGDGTFDVEIQDSGYGTLEIFRGVTVRPAQPIYTGTNEQFTLQGLESRFLQGGFGSNPTPITTVLNGVINAIGEYELHTVAVSGGQEIHTVLAAFPPGRILTLYFTDYCVLINSSTGNLALQTSYATAPGSVLALQSIGGKFREIARSDTNEDQDIPIVGTATDSMVLPYNVKTFYCVSVNVNGEVNNIYWRDPSYDIPNGTVVYLRTWSGEIVYKNLTGNLRLEGDFSAPTGAVLTLVNFLNVWHEVSRATTGSNVQQQVLQQQGENQVVTLTNTTRLVLLKSSGSVNNPSNPVIRMIGGADGDEINIAVSPTEIEEAPPSTYLTQRVPVKSNGTTADGYFKLVSDKIGLVPGDTLRVMRLTDPDGKYYWQEVSRSVIDIEPLLGFDMGGEIYGGPDKQIPGRLTVWRHRHMVANESGEESYWINYMSPEWLPVNTILAIRPWTWRFVITSNSAHGDSIHEDISETPNIVVVGDNGTYALKYENGIRVNAYFIKCGDGADKGAGQEEEPVSSPRNWIQIRTPKG